MLTLEQIIDLQEKGFSYEQLQIINALNTSIQESIPDSEESEPEPENPEPEKIEPESDRVKALEDEIGKLTDTIKAMQSANVRGAQAEPKKIETVDDIVKSFMVAS